MSRIAPIRSVSDLPPEHRSVAQAVLEMFGHIRGPFSMLLHSPELAQRLLPMVAFVRGDTVVEARLRFPAILSAALDCGSPYVWAAQVALARRSGVREVLIELVQARAPLEAFEPDERDIVQFARDLIARRRVDAQVFDSLHARHGERWMVELAAIVGFFAFVSTICTTFDVPAPEQAGADRRPA
jgi:4-carboxymuconolactone decarboxylase